MSSELLYVELKPQIQLVADALFALSENLLRKHGNFIPNGVVLTGDGKVRHVLAAPDNADDSTTSVEVLPLLHELLRSETSKTQATATGVGARVLRFRCPVHRPPAGKARSIHPLRGGVRLASERWRDGRWVSAARCADCRKRGRADQPCTQRIGSENFHAKISEPACAV